MYNGAWNNGIKNGYGTYENKTYKYGLMLHAKNIKFNKAKISKCSCWINKKIWGRIFRSCKSYGPRG